MSQVPLWCPGQSRLAVPFGWYSEPGWRSMWIPFPISSLWGCFWLSTLHVGLSSCPSTHIYAASQGCEPKFHETGLPEWDWRTNAGRFSKVTEVITPILYLPCQTQLSPSPTAGAQTGHSTSSLALHVRQSSTAGHAHLLQDHWRPKLLARNSNGPFLSTSFLAYSQYDGIMYLVLRSDTWRMDIPWENGAGLLLSPRAPGLSSHPWLCVEYRSRVNVEKKNKKACPRNTVIKPWQFEEKTQACIMYCSMLLFSL